MRAGAVSITSVIVQPNGEELKVEYAIVYANTVGAIVAETILNDAASGGTDSAAGSAAAGFAGGVLAQLEKNMEANPP